KISVSSLRVTVVAPRIPRLYMLPFPFQLFDHLAYFVQRHVGYDFYLSNTDGQHEDDFVLFEFLVVEHRRYDILIVQMRWNRSRQAEFAQQGSRLVVDRTVSAPIDGKQGRSRHPDRDGLAVQKLAIPANGLERMAN